MHAAKLNACCRILSRVHGSDQVRTLEPSFDWLTSSSGARSQANESLVLVTFTNQSYSIYTCHIQLARHSLKNRGKLAAPGLRAVGSHG